MSNAIQITDSQLIPTTDASAFEVQLRRAEIMAQAPFLPDAFRGNAGAVLIAVELADRLRLPVMAVCQNVYVVHGKPAFSGSFYISCINASGRYTPVDYEEKYDGERLAGVRVVVTRRSSGKTVQGPWVTLEMASKEGWLKNNPKWQTMPELMLRYRAASFFARTFCPDVVMGFPIEGEAEDIVNAEAAQAVPEPPKRKEKAPTIEPAYEPSQSVLAYATRMRQAPNKETLKAIQLEISADTELTPADKDFLRPIASGKKKEFTA